MDGPFPTIPFIEIVVTSVDRDHLIASHEGQVKRYAVGHLTQGALGELRIGCNHVTLMDLEHRTTLGIADELVIEGVRERDPRIDDLALDLIRAVAKDPAATLRSYAANAIAEASIEGREDNDPHLAIEYGRPSGGHSLAASHAMERCQFGHMTVIVDNRITDTIANAAIGMRLRDVVGHPFLRDTEAGITSVKLNPSTTVIHFEPKALRLSQIPELIGHRK
jgi:hypothetical protein